MTPTAWAMRRTGCDGSADWVELGEQQPAAEPGVVASPMFEPAPGHRLISVAEYRDPQGRPTCAAEWPDKRCQFLGWRKFALVPVCSVTESRLEEYEKLSCIKPCEGCIVWGANER
jgi:hypothetical protein